MQPPFAPFTPVHMRCLGLPIRRLGRLAPPLSAERGIPGRWFTIPRETADLAISADCEHLPARIDTDRPSIGYKFNFLVGGALCPDSIEHVRSRPSRIWFGYRTTLAVRKEDDETVAMV